MKLECEDDDRSEVVGFLKLVHESGNWRGWDELALHPVHQSKAHPRSVYLRIVYKNKCIRNCKNRDIPM
jgi:hypothetical protein